MQLPRGVCGRRDAAAPNVSQDRHMVALIPYERLGHPDTRLVCEDVVVPSISTPLSRFAVLDRTEGVVTSWLIVGRLSDHDGVIPPCVIN
jgi:hypothetical protein